jgi:hypothetical protein
MLFFYVGVASHDSIKHTESGLLLEYSSRPAGVLDIVHRPGLEN